MFAIARIVRVLLPILLLALALPLIFSTAAPQATASDVSMWHEVWSQQTNAFNRAVDVQSATTAPDHPVVQDLPTPVLQQAAADYPGENAKLWEDVRDPDTLLDLASLVLSVSPDRTQLGVDVFFFEPFNGYHLGPQSGSDAAWLELDTDMNPYTGSRLPAVGQPIFGYDYLLSFEWDTSVGWHVDIYRTPSNDAGSWYVVDSASASQSSNGTYSHIESEFALSTIGSPSEFDFSTFTLYHPTLSSWVPDSMPEIPLVGSYTIGTPTATTLPPTTSTTVPPTTTTTAPPSTTTTTLPMTTFVDVPSWHQYALQINDIAARGVVEGYGAGRFGPEDWVKRQQFAKMIVLAMGYPVSEADVCSFSDVDRPSNNLYPDNYVAVAAARGITLGVTPGHFAPWNDISRAQLITMVARAAGVGEPPATYSPPFGNFSDTHYPWARRAAFAGLLGGLQGMGSGYDFWAPATRGEVCVVLYNLLQR